jgi:hypothetical protein
MPAFDEWKPLHASHAIERVTARIHFGQSVNEVPWQKIQSEARDRAQKLQLHTEKQVQQYGLFINESESRIEKPRPLGIDLLHFERPEFYSEKLEIRRDSVAFEVFRYVRWAGFAENVRSLLLPLSEKYLAAVPIKGVQLEYVDRFDAEESVQEPNCGAVIRRDSELVTTKAFRETDPWHCHSGWFEWPEEGTVKRLANVDIDVADIPASTLGEPLRVIRIRTHLTDFFNQPRLTPTPNDALTTDYLAHRLERLHDELKELLRLVLTQAAADSVSLGG